MTSEEKYHEDMGKVCKQILQDTEFHSSTIISSLMAAIEVVLKDERLCYEVLASQADLLEEFANKNPPPKSFYEKAPQLAAVHLRELANWYLKPVEDRSMEIMSPLQFLHNCATNGNPPSNPFEKDD